VNISETVTFLRRSIAEFEDCERRVNKQQRMDDAIKKGVSALANTKVYLLADSRIMLSPELIFGQNWGDVYVAQILLENTKGNPGSINLEYLISQFGPKPVVIAIPLKNTSEAVGADDRIEAIVNGLRDGVLFNEHFGKDGMSIHSFGVDTSTYQVSEIDYTEAC